MNKTWILIFLILFIPYPALADVNFADHPEAKSFIKTMVAQYHFKKKALIKLFSNVKVRPKVIESTKNPLETKPWYSYQMSFVNEWRIREGVKFWNKYEDVLNRAEKEFGVPASIIVATIGIETKYGQRTGGYRVIDALTNLAFSDSARSHYFRDELKEFLLLSREHKLDPLKVKGSYAGAIGQPQFMPSSYRRYAIDFAGDSKIDLANNEADVIGSIANYYKEHGWKSGEPVAYPATAFKSSHVSNLITHREPLSLAILETYGVYPQKEIDYDDDTQVKLVLLRNYFSNEYWLGFHNFDVIKRYNNSDLYAMAVFKLSHYIAALKEKSNNV